jgi:hypothetical protein
VASALNLELVVDHPDAGPLVSAYLAGDPAVERFFGPHFAHAAAFHAKVAEVDQRFDRASRERAVERVIVPPGADGARLERFVEEGGYMVTTGQQPGLFGGPLYNISRWGGPASLLPTVFPRFATPISFWSCVMGILLSRATIKNYWPAMASMPNYTTVSLSTWSQKRKP